MDTKIKFSFTKKGTTDNIAFPSQENYGKTYNFVGGTDTIVSTFTATRSCHTLNLCFIVPQ